jgi:hypothetical protein
MSTVKVKFPLCLTKYYATKGYGGVDVYIHVFLTSAFIGDECSASRPGHCTPGEVFTKRGGNVVANSRTGTWPSVTQYQCPRDTTAQKFTDPNQWQHEHFSRNSLPSETITIIDI